MYATAIAQLRASASRGLGSAANASERARFCCQCVRARTLRFSSWQVGCQSGNGIFYNLSDTLIWLRWFNHTGGLVVGIDGFEDYALDLQHRFDSVEPFSKLVGVHKVALHAAVHNQSSDPVNLGYFAKMAVTCCGGAWCHHFWRLDARGHSDHYCRITRRRVALHCPTAVCHNVSSNGDLPLPPTSYTPGLFRFDARELASRYLAPAH